MTKKWYCHSAATVALEAGPTEVVDLKGRQLELQGKLWKINKDKELLQ